MRRAVAVMVAAAFAVAACSSDGGGSVEAFCESAQRLADFQALGDVFEGDPDPEDIAEARDITSALADDAPSEVSDDAKIVVDAFNKFLDAIETIDPADEAALSEAIDPLFNDPEIDAASDSVNEFALAECGIDLE